jgi:hypothetical protein
MSKLGWDKRRGKSGMLGRSFAAPKLTSELTGRATTVGVYLESSTYVLGQLMHGMMRPLWSFGVPYGNPSTPVEYGRIARQSI